jgi:hypothetical protein
MLLHQQFCRVSATFLSWISLFLGSRRAKGIGQKCFTPQVRQTCWNLHFRKVGFGGLGKLYRDKVVSPVVFWRNRYLQRIKSGPILYGFFASIRASRRGSAANRRSGQRRFGDMLAPFGVCRHALPTKFPPRKVSGHGEFAGRLRGPCGEAYFEPGVQKGIQIPMVNLLTC